MIIINLHEMKSEEKLLEELILKCINWVVLD